MFRSVCVSAAVATAAVLFGSAAAPAVAAPATTASHAARILGEERAADGALRLDVASPAMARTVPVMILPAANDTAPRGVLYLLDGNSGQTDSNNWLHPAKGAAAQFLADKDVHTVFPVGGTGTLYTDWQGPHPAFGTVKWETFLTKELPPLIDARFNTNGNNAIGGISSGAEGAILLGERNPGFYRAVAGYSGCYATEGPMGKVLTDLLVVNGGADSEMMWGPHGGPHWQAHNIFHNASGLRGATVYLSSGNGLPGPHERLDDPQLARRVIIGGLLEAGSNVCTDQLAPVLREAGVNVVRSAQPVGEHDWPYWRDELARSWSVLEPLLR